MKILVINSGSSSLKFQVIDSESEKVLAKGLCERIGIDGIFTYRTDQVSVKEPVAMKDHTQAVHTLLDTLVDDKKGIIESFQEIDVIGHRLVHGGEKFTGSVVVTDQVIQAMTRRSKGSYRGVQRPCAFAQPGQSHRRGCLQKADARYADGGRV